MVSVSYAQAVRLLRGRPEFQQLLADAYLDEDPGLACRRFETSAEFRETSRLLGVAREDSPARRLLDLGAGNGIASYAFASTGLRVSAVEPDPSDEVGAAALRRACAGAGLDVEVHEAPAAQLPWASGTFDFVYARQVLHHAADLEQMIREAARVLRRGGRFLAVREPVVDDDAQLREFLRSHPLHSLHGKEHAYSLQRYLGAIRGAGLHLERVLGPWDSVVNYAPFTAADLRSRALRRARQRFGALGEVIGRTPPWRWLYRWRLKHDRSPGRLFAFLARKEED
jgi:SAM-dependent methyltransferase